MEKRKISYSIDQLIEFLSDQMELVNRITDEEDWSLAERLKALDAFGKTCSRIAALVEKQRKLEAGTAEHNWNETLDQVLQEMRKGGMSHDGIETRL